MLVPLSLVIASAGGGFVMAFYSVLLIALNRKMLPEYARLKGWRLPTEGHPARPTPS